jgi:hypothetical protein
MKEQNTKVLPTITIALAIALVEGLVVVLVIKEADAGCERGPAVNQSLLKSNGRCLDRGTI